MDLFLKWTWPWVTNNTFLDHFFKLFSKKPRDSPFGLKMMREVSSVPPYLLIDSEPMSRLTADCASVQISKISGHTSQHQSTKNLSYFGFSHLKSQSKKMKMSSQMKLGSIPEERYPFQKKSWGVTCGTWVFFSDHCKKKKKMNKMKQIVSKWYTKNNPNNNSNLSLKYCWNGAFIVILQGKLLQSFSKIVKNLNKYFFKKKYSKEAFCWRNWRADNATVVWTSRESPWSKKKKKKKIWIHGKENG